MSAFTANSGRAHFRSTGWPSSAPTLPRLRARSWPPLPRRREAPGGGHDRRGAGAPPRSSSSSPARARSMSAWGASSTPDAAGLSAASMRCDAAAAPAAGTAAGRALFGASGAGRARLLDEMAYRAARRCLRCNMRWRSCGSRGALSPAHGARPQRWASTPRPVAGVFSLEDGLKLIAARGRLMQSLPGDGEMVAVFADEGGVAGRGVAHAAGRVASPRQRARRPSSSPARATRSRGRRSRPRRLKEGIDVRRLGWRRAAHSPLVEPILDEFERSSPPGCASRAADRAGLQPDRAAWPRPRCPRRPTGGGTCASRCALPPFASNTLHAQGVTHFVEIGPHPMLLGLGQRVPAGCRGRRLGCRRCAAGARRTGTQMLESLAALYVDGADDRLGRLRPRPGAPPVIALPTYPFQRERYWSEGADQRRAARRAQSRRRDLWRRHVRVAAMSRQARAGPLDLALGTYAAAGSCWTG